jgi:hypothetical protein
MEALNKPVTTNAKLKMAALNHYFKAIASKKR